MRDNFKIDSGQYESYLKTGEISRGSSDELGRFAKSVDDHKTHAKTAIEENNIEVFSATLKEKYTVSGSISRNGEWRPYAYDKEDGVTYKEKNFYLDWKCRIEMLDHAIRYYRADMVERLLLSIEDPEVDPPYKYGSRFLGRRGNHLSKYELSHCFKNAACLTDASRLDVNRSPRVFTVIGALNKEARPNTGLASTMNALLSEPAALRITELLAQHAMKHHVCASLRKYELSSVLSDEQKDFFVQVFSLQNYLHQLKNAFEKHGLDKDGFYYAMLDRENCAENKVVINLLGKKIRKVNSTLENLVMNHCNMDQNGVNKIIEDIVTALHEVQFQHTALTSNTVRAKFRAVCAFFSTSSANKISDHGGSVGALLNAQLAKLKETFPDYFKAAQEERTKSAKRDLRR